MPSVLVLAVLVCSCFILIADGPLDDGRRELAKLAHLSLNGLVKCAPSEFKAAVTGLSSSVRAKMESALREAAAKMDAPGRPGVDSTPRAADKPKIALKRFL